MQLIAEVEPIGVEGDVAVCYGHEDPVLGHPVEFIKVRQHQHTSTRRLKASAAATEGPSALGEAPGDA